MKFGSYKNMKSLSIIFILAFGLSVFGQTPEQPPPPFFTQWKVPDKCKICDQLTIEGATFRIISDENLYLAINPTFERGYWVTEVYLENKSVARFDFNPLANSGLLAWKTKEDFLNSQKSETFMPIDPVSIVKKIQRRAAWANALGAFGAGMQKQTATVSTQTNGTASVYGSNGQSASGIYNGTSTSTVTAPNTEAQAQAQRQAQQNNARVASTGNAMLDSALKNNTIFQNNKVFGDVYYPHKKNFDVVDFRFFINGRVYSFVYFVGKEKK